MLTAKIKKDAKRLTDDLLSVMDQIQDRPDKRDVLVEMLNCMRKADRHALMCALLDMVGQESCRRHAGTPVIQ